ncbi:integrase catalytic region [Leptotrichia hofstadii]|uniref:Integrase catalytic region n=1 Tax=Leptotrichia hofstadii TaxID=157688 RepID=A0A510JIF2_9FUSO|nr:integrase catalytic region [Leptotrichia hofstadii]
MLNNYNTISKKCHYKHLTPYNRGQIQAYRNEGKSIRFIAKMLEKNLSTISRKLKRNSVTQMPTPLLKLLLPSIK